jgi:cyclic beta-1,2-glucan synthetase
MTRRSTSSAYETDRERFVGRGLNGLGATCDAGRHDAVRQPGLGARSGGCDPRRITLEPDQTVSVDLVYGIGDSRDAVLGLVEKYQDQRLADRVFELAWTHAQVVLRQINASEADAQLYGRLANSVIFANASQCAPKAAS